MEDLTDKALGASGFSKDYWDENYDSPDQMDGIGNVKEHIGYIKNLFGLEYIDISSIIDFGFGLGHFFEEALKEFIPYKAIGIEPSKHAYDLVLKREISPVESINLKLYHMDLVSFAKKNSRLKRHDLGICTSVLQYLSDEELEFIIPYMAKKCKYLYLSVPTDKELKRQVEELEFEDQYAISRSRTRYLKLLRPYFTVVSSRVLESREHFDEESTSFTDLLYRF